MTYALLCVTFLAAAAVVTAVAWRRAPRGHIAALALSAVALLVLTAVFDTIMIAAGLFGYADGQISGLRIGLAPIEDFAYPLAGVLLLPALWNLLGRRGDASERPAASARERHADGDPRG